MIFLYRDGKYKVMEYAPDRKIMKKFHKDQDKIKAVMIECYTRLHSDVFTIIDAKHFQATEPFDVKYRIGIYSPDIPINTDTTIERKVHIDDIYSLYNMAALIYQIDCCSDVGDDMSLGESRIVLLELSLKYRDRTETWDPDCGSAVEFLNENGIYCDTDKFLDASIPKERMVEDGCYITRREGDMHKIMYYYHDKRNYLHLNRGRWSLLDTLTMRISDMDAEDNGIDAYGICMNRTGLLYLAVYEMAKNLEDCDSCAIDVGFCKWIRGEKIWTEDQAFTRSYQSYNMPDTLYMALILPQIWDLEKFLFGVVPRDLAIEFMQHKVYVKSDTFEFAKPNPDEGLHLDLFAYMTRVANTTSMKISFDDGSPRFTPAFY